MWIKIDTDDYKTFPNEGETVMTTDGKVVFPLWFIKSGEYRWINLNEETEREEPLPFQPTHWMGMSDWDIYVRILQRERKINQIID